MLYIETKRLWIRPLCVEDSDALSAVLSDKETMRYIEASFDFEKTMLFIQEAGMRPNPLVYALVLKENKRLIGHVIFHPFDEFSYEIGWVLHAPYWGQGFAGEITEALMAYARRERICALVLECDAQQEASKRIAQKFGFLLEKTEGNLCVYRKIL